VVVRSCVEVAGGESNPTTRRAARLPVVPEADRASSRRPVATRRPLACQWHSWPTGGITGDLVQDQNDDRDAGESPRGDSGTQARVPVVDEAARVSMQTLASLAVIRSSGLQRS